MQREHCNCDCIIQLAARLGEDFESWGKLGFIKSVRSCNLNDESRRAIQYERLDFYVLSELNAVKVRAKLIKIQGERM